MEKNKTKKHKKGQKTKRCLLSSTRHQGSTVFSFVFFLPLKSWITKKQNNSNEKADKSAGGTVALEVEKERKQRKCWYWGDLNSRAEHTKQTTRFMQETEGRSGYYVVDHNAYVGQISIWLWYVGLQKKRRIQDFGFCMLESHYIMTSWVGTGIFKS